MKPEASDLLRRHFPDLEARLQVNEAEQIARLIGERDWWKAYANSAKEILFEELKLLPPE